MLKKMPVNICFGDSYFLCCFLRGFFRKLLILLKYEFLETTMISDRLSLWTSKDGGD